MQTFTRIAELRTQLASWRRSGARIALVPTMGNLHDGHLRLIKEARQQADKVIASLFVNPLQFGAGEDFARYPRTLAVDEEKLRAAGCDALFAPDEAAMYPRGREGLSFVEVPELANDLCGAQRPGHFRGVATVVAKLFNIVQPDLAVFGEKDCQQLHIIRRMVRDLDVPVQIVGVPTVREADGLAMSSRNAYLNAEERRRAAELPRVLQALAARFKAGETDFRALEQAGEQLLREAGFEPDYLSLRRAADLAPPPPGERQLILLAAARLGKTRLIDNLPIDL